MFKAEIVKNLLIGGGSLFAVAGSGVAAIYFDEISTLFSEQFENPTVVPSKFNVDELRKGDFINFFTAKTKDESDKFEDKDLEKKITCKYTPTSGGTEVVDNNCVVRKLSMFDKNEKNEEVSYYKFKISDDLFKSFTGSTDLNNFDPDNLKIHDTSFSNSKDFKIEFTDGSSTKTVNFTINSISFYKTSSLPEKQTNTLN